MNIALLILSANDVRNMRPVKTLSIFDGVSRNFHPDGLFSSETFGKKGQEARNRLYSYLNIHTPVFHPVVYKALTDLKGLYGEIMAGKTYAIFDSAAKDFVKSDPMNGRTGFQFFTENFKELKFEQRPSSKREFNIRLTNKYRENCMMDKLVIMPAGLRDYEVDDNGKPSEDEINGLYRKVLSVASVVENVNQKINPEYVDSARYQLQIAVLDIYNHIVGLLEGKNKLILGKWASRKIINTTRNVITSYVPDSQELHGPRVARTDQTVVGMYQYMRMILPLAVKHLRDGFLSQVFTGPNTPAVLVNKKTLKKEMVMLDPEYFDEWMSYDGLEKVMARFGEEDLRHEKLEIAGYWMGLLYDDGKSYRFVQDKDELPDDYDVKNLRPLTYSELLYLSIYKDSASIPIFVTRYPITGYGSIYPSYIYMKSTVKSVTKKELGADWSPTGDVAYEFPIDGGQFYNSMSVNVNHLLRLGADHDGDMCSGTAVLTEDAKEEVKKLLNSRNYYVGVDGRMAFSGNNDVIDLVLSCMTG